MVCHALLSGLDLTQTMPNHIYIGTTQYSSKQGAQLQGVVIHAGIRVSDACLCAECRAWAKATCRPWPQAAPPPQSVRHALPAHTTPRQVLGGIQIRIYVNAYSGQQGYLYSLTTFGGALVFKWLAANPI